MEVVVREADGPLAPVLARLQLDTAIAAYSNIFPPEAPVPSYDELVAAWQRSLEPDREARRRAFVAEQATEIVGVVLAGPDPEGSESGHLARLYVVPARWGSGTGRQLHDAAVHHLQTAGFTTATLWVLERNERVRAWYERLGWQLTGERRPIYSPAGIDDLQYRLDL